MLSGKVFGVPARGRKIGQKTRLKIGLKVGQKVGWARSNSHIGACAGAVVSADFGRDGFRLMALIVAAWTGLVGIGTTVAADREQAIGRIEQSFGPARLERSGVVDRVLPAVVAQPVQRGDRLATGPGGHLAITLHDGTRLVLGEVTSITIREFVPPANEMRASLWGGHIGGAMRIELQRGIVRLTAAAVERSHRNRSELRTEAGTINAGGALHDGAWDVVARYAANALSVLLLSGRIEVRNLAGSAVLDRPRHGFDEVEVNREPGRAFGWHRDRIERTMAELAMP